MGEGYEKTVYTVQQQKESRDGDVPKEGNLQGSGEQWILFKMNVQLDDDREETLVVRAGDMAREVSRQFCGQHGLSHDFIPVLTETVQQQINQVQC